MQPPKSSFELLRAKSILAILDGDQAFGEIERADSKQKIRIAMPYLSGPTLCDISNLFGCPVVYGANGVTQSRWSYLDDLFEYSIRNHRESDLLGYLFSKEQFAETLRGLTPEEIASSYNRIVTTVIEKINGALYFGGHELVKSGNQFHVQKIGEAVKVAAPAIQIINREYISDLSDRAMQDVQAGNYDSAITKCRTLLEEVFCFVIEKKGDTPSDSGDIGKLYNQVKQLYNMHQDKDVDKRINGLLSGLEKILNAIAEMRNKGSDAHGVGAGRINIAEHHARLFVNSAMTMADFVLAVGERSVK